MISSLFEIYYGSIDRASSLNQYDHVVLLVLSRPRAVSLNPRGAPTGSTPDARARIAKCACEKVCVRDRKNAQMEEGRTRAGGHRLTPSRASSNEADLAAHETIAFR